VLHHVHNFFCSFTEVYFLKILRELPGLQLGESQKVFHVEPDEVDRRLRNSQARLEIIGNRSKLLYNLLVVPRSKPLHELGGSHNIFSLPLDLRHYGVERVPHFVADSRVHDAHVLPLDVQELALDAERDVLDLDHYFGLLRARCLVHLDDLYLIEGNLRISGLDYFLNLIHLGGPGDLK